MRLGVCAYLQFLPVGRHRRSLSRMSKARHSWHRERRCVLAQQPFRARIADGQHCAAPVRELGAATARTAAFDWKTPAALGEKKIAHDERGRWRLALEERGGWARSFSHDTALSLRQLKKFVNRWADSDHLRRSKSISSCLY